MTLQEIRLEFSALQMQSHTLSCKYCMYCLYTYHTRYVYMVEPYMVLQPELHTTCSLKSIFTTLNVFQCKWTKLIQMLHIHRCIQLHVFFFSVVAFVVWRTVYYKWCILPLLHCSSSHCVGIPLLRIWLMRLLSQMPWKPDCCREMHFSRHPLGISHLCLYFWDWHAAVQPPSDAVLETSSWIPSSWSSVKSGLLWHHTSPILDALYMAPLSNLSSCTCFPRRLWFTYDAILVSSSGILHMSHLWSLQSHYGTSTAHF